MDSEWSVYDNSLVSLDYSNAEIAKQRSNTYIVWIAY